MKMFVALAICSFLLMLASIYQVVTQEEAPVNCSIIPNC